MPNDSNLYPSAQPAPPTPTVSLLTQLLADGDLSVFVKHPDSRGLIHRRLCTLDGLATFVDSYASSPYWDFFVCPNQHSHYNKPNTAAMLSLEWLVLDLDPIVAAAASTVSQNALSSICDDFMGGLSTVVYSGRGYHLWYRIGMNRQDSIGPMGAIEFIRRAKYAAECLTQPLANLGWALDPTSFDWSHIFRLPGTVNRKTGNMATVTRWAGIVPIPRCLPEQWVAVPASTAQDRTHLVNPDVASVLCAVSPQARNFIMHGAIPGIESRHRQAFITSVQLLELGVPLNTALLYVSQGASRCMPALTDHADIVRRVYAR